MILIKTICPTAAHAQLSSVCLWFVVVWFLYLLSVTFLLKIYALDLVCVFFVCIYLYMFFTIWLLFFTINNISPSTHTFVCVCVLCHNFISLIWKAQFTMWWMWWSERNIKPCQRKKNIHKHKQQQKKSWLCQSTTDSIFLVSCFYCKANTKNNSNFFVYF